MVTVDTFFCFCTIILNTKQSNLTDNKIIISVRVLYLSDINPLVRISVYPPHQIIP